MSSDGYIKISCPDCGGHVEFPEDGIGMTIDCPHCAQPLLLKPPIIFDPAEKLTFNCLRCLCTFARTYEEARQGVFCTICGQEKDSVEMTKLEILKLFKHALNSGDLKFRVKITAEP